VSGATTSDPRLLEGRALEPSFAGHFERDGFVLVPEAVPADALLPFAPVVAEVAAGSAQAKVPLDERGTYQRAFVQEPNLWQRHEAIRPLAFSPRLARMAAEVLGVDGVRMYHDQALVKEAGGGHTPWHCDQHYWPIDSDRTVTAWIPLQAVPLEMGPLRFSAGSQHVDLGRALAIGDESDAGVRRHPRWRELPVWEQAIELGDVTFHQGWTFHGAGPNTTDETRLVFTVIYVADGARLAEPRTDGQRFDRQIWLPDTEVGEPVTSWLNPMVWHRDGGHEATVAALPAPARQIGTFTLP
jgi:ectoine hydroxylase-related dioxygenase (phytanoyl-CoA dioxygenase family)